MTDDHVLYGTVASNFFGSTKIGLEEAGIKFRTEDLGYIQHWRSAGVLPIFYNAKKKTYQCDSTKIIYSMTNKWSMEELLKMRDEADENRVHLWPHFAKQGIYEFSVRLFNCGGWKDENAPTIMECYYRILLALKP
eukprot:UN22002